MPEISYEEVRRAMCERSTLLQDRGSDYVLGEDLSCWVTVGKLSVYIWNSIDELLVEVYHRGREMEDALGRINLPKP